MANIRVKDLPNADTLADADEMIIDSSGSGTRRIAYSELKTEVAADYVAAPSTYKLATLGNDNRLTTDQIPDSISQGLNFVGNANSAGDLTSTTQGDFYVIQTAFDSYAVGDQAVYNGSSYVRVTDGTKQIEEGGTGATTLSGAQTELKIPSIGLQPNQVPLSGMLNSGAWLNFDAFYETGTWTPTVSFSGGSTGIALTSEGIYTRLGNTVCLRGVITLTDKGSDSGTARIGGLPHSTANTSTSYQTAPVMIFDASSLTSAVTGLFEDNQPNIILYQTSASGGAAVTNANFTNTTSIRFSGTYQIA
jgi:hypothetical protein